MNSNQMAMNHPRGKPSLDSDSCSDSILSSSLLSQPASDLGRNRHFSNLNATATQPRRKIFEPIQKKKDLMIPNSIDDHESQLESFLSSRVVSNRSSQFNENRSHEKIMPKTEISSKSNYQDHQRVPPHQNLKNSIVVGADSHRQNPQQDPRLDLRHDFQFESAAINGNGNGNLDTSMASTITAQTTFRKRIKPIVVMNINISSDKKEEVQIFEDSNPIEVAENFCRFHNLPFTLVEILSNNIRAQVQNYYRIRSEKQREDSICKSFFNQDTSIVFADDSRKPRTIKKSLHYLDTIEPEENLNEETFEHHPEPHYYPQNPALKQSVSQEANFLKAIEHDRLLQTEPDQPTEISEPNKKLKLKIKQKLLDLNLIQSTEPPMETSERQNFEQEQQLQKIDDEIAKLQRRKEEIYEKYGSTRPQTTKASASPVISFKPTQKFVKLKFKNEKKVVNKENMQTPTHKKVSGLDFDFDFENNNAHTPKLKSSNRKSRSTAIESDSKKFASSRPSTKFFEDYIQNPEQMYRENTSYAQLHREKEERRLRSQSKNNNKSFSIAASKSPKSGRKNSRTPEKSLNSPFFNKLETPQKNGFSSGKKDRSLDLLFSQAKSNAESSFANSFYSKQNPDIKDREERLLRTTLNQIFNSLDDDADGRISIEKVDVSTLQPEILEELAEIFQALEDDMELNFQDFYNIVNRKRLLERLKKDFNFTSHNNNVSTSIFRIES